MGLLRFSRFSSIPTLFRKIQAKRQEKEKYQPNDKEHASRNRIQQFIDNVKSDAVQETIFTVPSESIFFITRVQLSLNSLGDNGGERAIISLNIATAQNVLIALQGTDGVGVGVVTQSESHADFSMPIKVLPGQVIRHDNPTNGQSTAIIIGWLEPSSEEIV